ncbi:uncharacterized protein LOC131235445 [Magnolia sinica]|uniref:uncharacterized protein LOC131235445 n=1 Tax=Magnolia sinica TaxID=86752 RepID=UPI00265A91FA|nr:uncharacterized protein LOC131235445 [Magnolia sinica]
MGLKYGSGFPLLFHVLVLTSMPAASWAATKIVGGSDHWRYGFNYTDWALKNAPFYQNDTLVFMYDPPTNITFPHSVSLLKDSKSLSACDFTTAKLVASVVQGIGKGFEFVLKKRKPYYFACGEHERLHCTAGQMKFSVTPLKRRCRG